VGVGELDKVLQSSLGFPDSAGVFTLPYLRHLKFITTRSNFLYYNLDSFGPHFQVNFSSYCPPDLPRLKATEPTEAALLVEPVLFERSCAGQQHLDTNHTIKQLLLQILLVQACPIGHERISVKKYLHRVFYFYLFIVEAAQFLHFYTTQQIAEKQKVYTTFLGQPFSYPTFLLMYITQDVVGS
jgi:hypothetical protein